MIASDPIDHGMFAHIRPEVMEDLKRTSEWCQYQEELLIVAEAVVPVEPESRLANMVKTLRGEARWTQEDLAAKANVSVGTIQNIEGGKEASRTTMSKLSAAFSTKLGRTVAFD